jgi:hypothetical protein
VKPHGIGKTVIIGSVSDENHTYMHTYRNACTYINIFVCIKMPPDQFKLCSKAGVRGGNLKFMNL